VISIFFALTFLLSALFSGSWGYYQILSSISFILYLLTILSLFNSEPVADMIGKSWFVIPLFLVPLIIQLLLLCLDPSFSQDIMRLQFRGEAIVDGLSPYDDFEINKPPLYIWMVSAISYLLGPDEKSFRFVFVLFNSLIPPVMMLIGRQNVLGHACKGWKIGAVAYGLWPVALMETGIAGHFDPVVSFTVVLSFLFLARRRYSLSGLLLGAGFALKMFPVFLAPFFFLNIKDWKQRGVFFLCFFFVPILSSLPFLLQNPSGIIDYLMYQSSGWGSSMSFQFLLDLTGLAGNLIFIVAAVLLAAGLIFLIVAGLKGYHFHENIFIAGMISLTMLPLIYFMIILIAGTSGLGLFLGMIPIMASVSVILASILLISLSRKTKPRNDATLKNLLKSSIPLDRVMVLSALSLILLLLVSAQFHPWYLIWVAPFTMASDPRIGWTFLLLSGPLHYNAYAPWDMGGMF
jgi:hypothetical protein